MSKTKKFLIVFPLIFYFCFFIGKNIVFATPDIIPPGTSLPPPGESPTTPGEGTFPPSPLPPSVGGTTGGEELTEEQIKSICGCPWSLLQWWQLIVCWLWCIVKLFIILFFLIIATAIIIVFFIFAFVGIVGAGILQTIGGQIIINALDWATRLLDQLGPLYSAVRAFANWFFAVFLAFIGLATILRIESYWARRALVPLLVVALIFNFIPFFVRTIINIGNSFTCWALGLVKYATPSGQNNPTININCEDPGNSRFLFFQNIWDVMQNFSNLLKTFVTSVFHLIGVGLKDLDLFFIAIGVLLIAFLCFTLFWYGLMFAFLLLALFFVIRAVYLFLLYIVAPIPFVLIPLRRTEIGSAFPRVLNWEGWLEDLLKWAFGGMVIGFWLALAVFLLNNPLSINITSGVFAPFLGQTYSGFATSVEALFNTSFSYSGALVALFTGLVTLPGALEGLGRLGVAAVTGAGALIAAQGLRWGMRAGKSLVGATQKIPGVGKATAWTAEKIAPTVRRLRQRMESITGMEATMKGVGEELLKGVPFARTMAERLKGAKMAEEARLKKVEEDYRKMPNEKLEGEILSRLTPPEQKRIAMNILAERGRISPALAQQVFSGKTLEQITREYGPNVADLLTRQRLDLLQYVTNPKTGAPYTLDEIGQEFISKITPGDITKLAPEVLQVAEFFTHMDRAQISTLLSRASQATLDIIKDNIPQITGVFRAKISPLQSQRHSLRRLKSQRPLTLDEQQKLNNLTKQIEKLTDVVRAIYSHPRLYLK